MIEIPLSIVAWVSVVLVQAIVHYVVLSARGARRIEDENFMIEESLSLATNDGSLDASDEIPGSPDSFFNSDSLGVKEELDEDFELLRKPLITRDELWDGDEPQNFLQLLTQTGSELIQVRFNQTCARPFCLCLFDNSHD